MPVYEFQCPQKHITDEFFKGGEATAAVVCKRCGMEAKRIISMPRMVVKKGKESPAATVRRLQGAKRGEKFFDSPFTDKRIYKRGSQKDFEAAIKRDVVESEYGKQNDIKESEVTITNP